MRARIAILLVFVIGALAAVLAVAVSALSEDRDELIADFAAEREQQLEAALIDIEADIESVTNDLRLAVELIATGGHDDSRTRDLEAIVAVGRAYTAAAVCQPDGSVVVHAGDATPATVDPLPMGATCRDALAMPGRVRTSPPVAYGNRWLRVFAIAGTGADPVGVALAVDGEQLFSQMKIISANDDTRFVILGEHGVPAPATDPALREALTTDTGQLPGISQLVEAMRDGKSGLLWIDREQARVLGLGAADVVAIYRPVAVEGGASWSTALLATTAAIRSHEQAITRRMIAVLVITFIMIVSISAFIVVTTTRTVRLRERLQRADEVAHLVNKTQKVLDTIPTGFVVLGDDGRVTAVNEQLRGHHAPTLPCDLAEVFPAADPRTIEEIDGLLARTQETGEPSSHYVTLAQLHGEEGSYNFHAVPLDPPFPDARALLVVEDLTRIGSLERQLVRSEKLATVGVLAAGIAHEIGTPLGIARGRAEYMLDKRLDAEAAALGHRVIIEQIDHVTRTIRRLLDFSRVQPSMSATPQDLGAVARAVAELTRVEAEKRGLRVEVDVPAHTPMLLANADELEQALVNLVMNACDASEAGGTIRIAAGVPARAEEAVELWVHDEGRGIAQDDHERVFDPFYTTKKRGRGTGLGLSIVAQIVRNHGGTVRLDSAPGQGTTVRMFWPAARTASARRSHA